MFWVALASLILVLTGGGDDTKAFREQMARNRAALQAVVGDSARIGLATTAIDDAERAFGDHRARLDEMGRCIERLDRTYRVTAAEYDGCTAGADASWDRLTDEVVAAELRMRQALSDAEWAAVQDSLRAQEKK